MRTHEKWLLVAITFTVLRWVVMATLDGTAETILGVALGILTLVCAAVAFVAWRREGPRRS
ncbi:hypothetical protein GCM10009633_19120 [Janibacter melonis]|uniref:hypothetical protein n=1 Tax=Janibacter melonis TaxID=262209 RepID=UPI001E4CA846|nr:hypothetical protein [Janibacter melonis]MCB5991770.1 hypothetical protein [Janibacter melonis]